MFILRNILTPLQNEFSSTPLGRQRSRLFVYALLAFIVPFTSSISSNILRSLNTLFGLSVNRRQFYTFMASNKLPWIELWQGLYIHGIKQATMDRTVAGIVEHDSKSTNGRPLVDRPG
jgi:hypothetical protein